MKIFLDRIAEDQNGMKIATFEVGENFISFTSEQMPSGFVEKLIPNAIVECEIVNGCIVNPVILYEETKKTEEEMKKRLQSLFSKRKR